MSGLLYVRMGHLPTSPARKTWSALSLKAAADQPPVALGRVVPDSGITPDCEICFRDKLPSRNGAGDRRGRSQCANDYLRLALI